jgi:hypothetical protein
MSKTVIPADKVLGDEARIQSFQELPDPRLRGGEFLTHILQLNVPIHPPALQAALSRNFL